MEIYNGYFLDFENFYNKYYKNICKLSKYI